jgi:hypothetical protein
VSLNKEQLTKLEYRLSVVRLSMRELSNRARWMGYSKALKELAMIEGNARKAREEIEKIEMQERLPV